MQNSNIFLGKYFMEIHENEAQILVVTLNEVIISSFGVDKHQIWYNIGKLVETIGKRNAQGFPDFHFCICLPVMIHPPVWDTWLAHDESEEGLTELFIELNYMPSEIDIIYEVLN